MRLDLFLVKKTGVSRHQIQKMIAQGGVRVEGEVVVKPSHLVRGSEEIRYCLPEQNESPILIAQNIPLDILYEDNQIIVVNKPAGMVTHPGAGNPSQTLANALVYAYGSLPHAGDPLKPGIVHRLDKGTSGCLVVARTEESLQNLQQQFKNRQVEKIYLALVYGLPPAEGVFDKPIGRHPVLRQKISSRAKKAKAAVTEWKVLKTFGQKYSWVEIRLHTGRTHQIRVHFTEGGFPLVGDPVYGRPFKTQKLGISRPALHAHRLGFFHPTRGERVEFTAPLPQDLNELLKSLREKAI